MPCNNASATPQKPAPATNSPVRENPALADARAVNSIDPAPLLAAIHQMQFPGHSAENPLRLMEICGTHTMAIARAGLKQLLPPTVRLISGPGCPVCVTPASAIEDALHLARLPGVLVATYGDLLRVPGNRPTGGKAPATLAGCRAAGADVRVVYSAMDALALARQNPQKTVVFLGVGFETTAPGTAATVAAAKREGVTNFTLLSLLKRTAPALRALLAGPEPRIDGFLCPGHVATITGAEAFAFLPGEYHLPAVVAGFEAGDIFAAVYALCRQAARPAGQPPRLENEYTRAVRPGGNPGARAMTAAVFAPVDDDWRGLGYLPQSGLRLRPEYAALDAAQRFGLAPHAPQENTAQENAPQAEPGGCRCGAVLRGQLEPPACPLFGTACTPLAPVGPCMVSGEGACAAAYKYRSLAL
ncbi:MAG: hydrogenase formation protein HypD [Gemmiger sp.]|nr:hydrogenase formation protein HypD [Gemmiger sp.]